MSLNVQCSCTHCSDVVGRQRSRMCFWIEDKNVVPDVAIDTSWQHHLIQTINSVLSPSPGHMMGIQPASLKRFMSMARYQCSSRDTNKNSFVLQTYFHTVTRAWWGKIKVWNVTVSRAETLGQTVKAGNWCGIILPIKKKKKEKKLISVQLLTVCVVNSYTPQTHK